MRGLPAGADFARGLVPQEPGPGSGGAAAAHSRDGSCTAAVRISADPRDAAPRGLGGEQEARAAAVSTRRAAAAHAGAPSQAHVPASRSGAAAPQRAHERWSMDFVHERCSTVGRFAMLTVVDQWSRWSPVPGGGFGADRQRRRRGAGAGRSSDTAQPQSITVDHGTEFTSKALEEWAYRRGVKLDFIRPGKPTENGHIESFNGRLRDECLNVNQFVSLEDARAQDRSVAGRLQSPSSAQLSRAPDPERVHPKRQATRTSESSGFLDSNCLRTGPTSGFPNGLGDFYRFDGDAGGRVEIFAITVD